MDEATAESPERANSLGTGIWIVLGVIVFTWVAYWLWVAPLVTESKFDPLNALFSGLAFWGVIYAILLQKSELALQRRELELTRGEVRGQKEQLETQNLTMKYQRFENTFFSLLNLFIGITNSIELTLNPGRQTHHKGRECFAALYREFQQQYISAMQRAAPNTDLSALCIIVYEQLPDHIGHYFRTLHNIVMFIDTSDMNNKQMYIDILRTQLSTSELTLLFYNCISKYGSEKFRPLVEKYGILENLDFSTLINHEHIELFAQSAFHCPSKATKECV